MLPSDIIYNVLLPFVDYTSIIHLRRINKLFNKLIIIYAREFTQKLLQFSYSDDISNLLYVAQHNKDLLNYSIKKKNTEEYTKISYKYYHEKQIYTIEDFSFDGESEKIWLTIKVNRSHIMSFYIFDDCLNKESFVFSPNDLHGLHISAIIRLLAENNDLYAMHVNKIMKLIDTKSFFLIIINKMLSLDIIEYGIITFMLDSEVYKLRLISKNFNIAVLNIAKRFTFNHLENLMYLTFNRKFHKQYLVKKRMHAKLFIKFFINNVETNMLIEAIRKKGDAYIIKLFINGKKLCYNETNFEHASRYYHKYGRIFKANYHLIFSILTELNIKEFNNILGYPF